MIVENQGGYLFEDVVIESLLEKFDNLTYDNILLEMNHGNFKLKGDTVIDDELSIKTGSGTIAIPYFISITSVTYKDVQLDFKGKVCTLYLDIEKYTKELERQKLKFK